MALEQKLVSKTDTTISVKLSGLTDTYNGNQRYAHLFIYEGSSITPVQKLQNIAIANLISETQIFTFTGLSPSTKYTIKANINASDWTTPAYFPDLSVTTDETSNSRPSNWSWTTTEKNAFDKQGDITILTYSRWNQFVDRVGNFIWYYYNSTQAQIYQNYLNDAYMTSSDRTLTATRFNNVRRSIGSIVATDIDPVSPGDKVYGSYFITLANKLNAIP